MEHRTGCAADSVNGRSHLIQQIRPLPRPEFDHPEFQKKWGADSRAHSNFRKNGLDGIESTLFLPKKIFFLTDKAILCYSPVGYQMARTCFEILGKEKPFLPNGKKGQIDSINQSNSHILGDHLSQIINFDFIFHYNWQ